jgi:hypothetical protein
VHDQSDKTIPSDCASKNRCEGLDSWGMNHRFHRFHWFPGHPLDTAFSAPGRRPGSLPLATPQSLAHECPLARLTLRLLCAQLVAPCGTCRHVRSSRRVAGHVLGTYRSRRSSRPRRDPEVVSSCLRRLPEYPRPTRQHRPGLSTERLTNQPHAQVLTHNRA